MDVCFSRGVSLPAFVPGAPGVFGGADVRAATLARGLARRGMDVGFLVWSSPALPAGRVDGVRIVGVEPSADDRARARLDPILTGGVRAISLRKLGPGAAGALASVAARKALRLAGQWSTGGPVRGPDLRHVDAGVFCCVGLETLTPHVVRHARDRGRRSVLLLASDQDVLWGERRTWLGEQARLFDWTVRTADVLVTQTRGQAEELLRRYGRAASVLANPVDTTRRAERRAPGEHVLWVGRASSLDKRPELCIELARKRPALPFVLIMNRVPGDPLYDEISARLPPNVRVIERVDADAIDGWYAAALALVNTSSFEGFPNTFLAAAKYEVPIVSLDVDPDGFLAREGCGTVAGGDLDAMARALDAVVAADAGVVAATARALRRVQTVHAVDVVVEQLSALLESIVPSRRQPR